MANRGQISCLSSTSEPQLPGSEKEREKRKMVTKEILLVHKDGGHHQVEQKTNGSLWLGGEKIFSSEAEAGQKGWKVDAIKVILVPTSPRENSEIIGPHERVAR